MQCLAITNKGTQCSRKSLSNSKYCWQHQNYQENNILISQTQYFENIPLLQNTLLTYFNTEEDLKILNKQFKNLDYEKYNTHIQPHGILEIYYIKTKTIEERITYKNGKLDGLYEIFYENGELYEKSNWKMEKGMD